MISINLKDKDLFGNEAGEDENPDLLNSYFVDYDDFDKFYDKEEHLSIVSARKGMGKSALLSRLSWKLKKESNYQSPIVIRLKGNELLGFGDFSEKDQAWLENYWKKVLFEKIVYEICEVFNINLLKDQLDKMELHSFPIRKNDNIINGLSSRIISQTSSLQAESEIKKHIEENSYKEVWLLIDDIDAKYQDSLEYQFRIGSFFSAIRSMAFDVDNLNIRATVRSDVWSCLRHLEDLDKLEQYIIEIFWTKRHMRDILANRILSYIKRNNPNSIESKYTISRDYNKIIEVVFQSPIKWNDRDASIFEAISTFSNRRPRWMGQLCKMAADKAKAIPQTTKIRIEHIRYTLSEFGKKRRDDLIKEHQHQFSELAQLIDAFRATNKEFFFEGINHAIEDNYIRSRRPENIPPVDGVAYASPVDLGNFLYKLGLISRIQTDDDDKKTFTHFTDDPDLYRSIENERGNIAWSIHPSYRDFLNIK